MCTRAHVSCTIRTRTCTLHVHMLRATTNVVQVHMLRATTHVVHVQMLRATTLVACTSWSIARPTARPIHVHTDKCYVKHVQTFSTYTHACAACMHMLLATTNFASTCCLEHVRMLFTTTHVARTCRLEQCSNPNT